MGDGYLVVFPSSPARDVVARTPDPLPRWWVCLVLCLISDVLLIGVHQGCGLSGHTSPLVH